MNNEKLKKALCYGVAHGLKCQTPLGIMLLTSVSTIETKFPVWFHTSGDYENQDFNYKVLNSEGYKGKGYSFNNVKPIYRDWIDLTTEITHNGETFVPINVINKIIDQHHEGGMLTLDGFIDYSNYKGFIHQDMKIPYYVIESLREWKFNTESVPENQCIYQSQLKDRVYE